MSFPILRSIAFKISNISKSSLLYSERSRAHGRIVDFIKAQADLNDRVVNIVEALDGVRYYDGICLDELYRRVDVLERKRSLRRSQRRLRVNNVRRSS